jgi:hypothetical protein
MNKKFKTSKKTNLLNIILSNNPFTILNKFSFGSINMNSRGFNMFSALVAAILLMTSVVLTNMLISTEETLGSQVYLMSNNFNLSDASAMARSDALQSFNYNFRETLEQFLTQNDAELAAGTTINIINTDYLLASDGWEKIKKNFEVTILKYGTTITDDEGNITIRQNFDAVIELVANKTIDQFHDGRYGRYHVSLSDRSRETKKIMRDVMSKSITDSIGKIDFLKIVGCNEDNFVGSCPVGTFYFNIPLERMTAQQYESLPKIVVKDLVSGEEIKTPLLPKTRLSIYIPIRFFKAVFEAQKNAQALLEFEKYVNDNGNRGVAALGFCDYGSCEPRNNPLSKANKDTWTKACGSSISNPISQDLSGGGYLTITNYPITNLIGTTALRAFTRQKVCDFGLSVYQANPINETDFVNFNHVNKTGLQADNIAGIGGYDNCPFSKIYGVPDSKPTKKIQNITDNFLYCSTLKQIETSALFVDTNPQYIVSGTQNKYSIGITSRVFTVIDGISGTCTTTSSNGCGPA